jgi:uncharacterized caspase-like protein
LPPLADEGAFLIAINGDADLIARQKHQGDTAGDGQSGKQHDIGNHRWVTDACLSEDVVMGARNFSVFNGMGERQAAW